MLEHRNLLRDALQLADVARPGVGFEQLHGLGFQPHGRHHVAVGEICRELLEQQVDIILARAERRDGDGHRVEAVVEVFPELAGRDGLGQVDVGGGNHADIGLLHGGRTHLDEFAGLDHAQQADLRGEGQLRHFIEEERAAVGHLEIAFAGVDGAGEGPLLVTEQLGIDGPLRDGTAVHGEVRTVLARAEGVDDLRDGLLAHAALSRHQHGEVGPRHLAGHLDGAFQLRVVARNVETLLDILDIAIAFVHCHILQSYKF